MQETDYNNVLNIVSTNMTPLEAKIYLNAKLSIQETLQLKQYYASLHNVEKPNKKLLLEYGLIMMVGLPASGKTTLSNLFLTYFDESVIHLNQDELGRTGCYDTLCKFAKKQQNTIILDRCNLTSSERNEWISLYNSLSSRPILCVHFNAPADVCKQRLSNRTNHDMKNPNIIDNLVAKIQQPELNEGFYKIKEINEDDDLTALLREFGIQYQSPHSTLTGLKKFVRIKHLMNLGATGRDDLMWSGKELDDFMKQTLVIEEKIDGANLGIFIDEDGKIIVQNRSHYISPSYHEQFASIDKWKYQHMDDILQVLGNNPWIIYGEWVVARHSIHYTKLPDKFILFDIYDRSTGKFFSRSKVEELINGTSFHQIRKIAEGKFTLTQLKNFAYSPSIYYDGPVEGICARCFNDDDTLKYHGKIVRHNFLQPGWRTTDIVKNSFIQND